MSYVIGSILVKQADISSIYCVVGCDRCFLIATVSRVLVCFFLFFFYTLSSLPNSKEWTQLNRMYASMYPDRLTRHGLMNG